MTGFGQSFADPGFDPGQISRTATVNLNANTGQYAAQMRSAQQQTSSLGTAVDALSTKLDGLTRRTGRKLEIVSAGDLAALTGAVAHAANFDKQLSTLAATAAVTRTSFAGLKGAVDSAFTKFPVAHAQAVQLATAISSLGVTGARDIGSLTNTFIKLGAATGENTTGLATGLIQLSRMMGTANTQSIAQFANSLLTVSKNAGVSATGVLDFAQSIAPLARAGGIGEAAVIGIATAFTKAGASGYYAANTFNSMLSDITQATQTGSPALVKYATYLGMTVEQFKKLPAQTQLTDIFGKIAGGGQQTINFLNYLGLGTRALSSVQAVAQSGGLNQAISQAVGSATGTGNLNKGSKAAFGNLSDQLTILRNNFSQMGASIGETFVRPLTMATQVVTTLTRALQPLFHLLSPLIAVAGLAGGAVLGVAGAALVHAPLVATYALARNTLRSGSRTRATLGEAAGVGRAVRGGMTTAEALAASGVAGIGERPFLQRGPFALGYAAGLSGFGGGGGGTGPGMLSQGAGLLMAAPFRIGSWAARTQAEYLAAARQPISGGPNFLQRMGTTLSGFANRGEGTAAATEAKQLGGAFSQVRNAVLMFGASLVSVAKETTLTGVSMVGRGAGFAGGRLANMLPLGLGGAARFAGAGLARGASAVGRGLGALAGAAFSPLGILALGLGIPAYQAVSGMLRPKSSAYSAAEAGLNPLQQWNDALGIATTKVASFGDAVNQAKPSTTTATTFGAAGQITAQQIVAAQGQKVSGPAGQNIAAIFKAAPHNVAALSNLLAVTGVSDPRQLQMFASNALSAGYTPREVQQVVFGFSPGGQPNYGTLGRQIGSVAGSAGVSAAGRLVGAAFTGLQLQRQTAELTMPESTAQQQYLSGAQSLLMGLMNQAALPGAGQSKRQEALLAAIHRFTGQGGGYSNQEIAMLAGVGGMNPAQRAARLNQLINLNPAGTAFLNSASGLSTSMPVGNPLMNQLRATGALGTIFAGSAQVTGLEGSPQQPLAQQRAFDVMLAMSTSQLSRFQSIVAGTGDPLEQVANAALQAKNQLDKIASSTLSPEAQYGLAQTQLGQARARLQANPNDTQAQQDVQQTQQDAAQAQAGVTQHMLGQYQTLRDFDIQMTRATRDYNIQRGQAEQQYNLQSERATEDYQRQVYRSELQFNIQRERNATDYHLQVYRQELSFNIQMTRAAQDYQRQQMRTLQDYNRQLVNQAQQSAQNIYNPYARIQSTYTADAAELVYNLNQQNQAIFSQLGNVQQLRRMGVSTQAIQELGLSDSQNAQQTQNLVTTLMGNPQLVKQINQAIAVRLKGTTQLTQNAYNLQFVQSQKDFQVQLARTGQDFKLSQQRASADERLSLSQMAQDYHTATTRAAQDEALAMSQMQQDYQIAMHRAAQDEQIALNQMAQSFDNMVKDSTTDMRNAVTGVYGTFNQAVKMLSGEVEKNAAALGKSVTNSFRSALKNAQSVIAQIAGMGLSPSDATAGGAFGEHSGPGGGGGTPAQNQAWARGEAQASYGWNGANWTDLVMLWNRESGWNQNAVNQSSGAWGIPQALPGSKMAAYGSDWRTNPVTQMKWGLAYIASRYGNPINAWAHETAYGWYGRGGIATGPQLVGVGERGPEAILPLNGRGQEFMAGLIARSLRQAITMVSGGGNTHTMMQDCSTHFTGPVTVQANDPNAMARALQEKARLERLVHPHHA